MEKERLDLSGKNEKERGGKCFYLLAVKEGAKTKKGPTVGGHNRDQANH